MLMANNTVKRRRRKAASIRPKVKRLKTFKTEESAKKYAEKHKILDYKLVNLKNTQSKEKKLKMIV